MDSVARLRMLKTFDVRDTAVTEAAARSLANRSTVELYVSPELYGTNPQLEAFLKLGPIRGKVIIDGEAKRAWDAIEAIQNGGSITGLTWPVDPRRSSEDIPLLAKLPKLEQIVVSRDAIPKVHLPLLAKISGLRSLELAIYNAVDLNPIPNLEQLRSLTITSLSDEGLARIQKLQSLESLHIKLTSGPTIDKLAKAFPRLRELAFPKIEAESLANAIPFLESLESLTETSIAPKKDVWPILAKLKNLKDLNPRSANSSYIESIQRALPGVRVQAKK